MMKEQKETIERLNRIITTKFNNDYSIDSSDKEAIETVLNMLKEKDTEIEKKDNAVRKIIKRLNNEIDTENNAIETVLNMLKEKNREINSKNGTINALQCALKERTEERDRKDNIITKQNKIIDLMAEQIKIPEPTMKIESFDIKSKTKFGMRYLNKEEVKQYFERKSEE